MGYIKYKINNITDKWDTITFPGNSIMFYNLKRKILQQNNLLKNQEEFDYSITNIDTGEIYEDSNQSILSEVHLIIKRSPKFYEILKQSEKPIDKKYSNKSPLKTYSLPKESDKLNKKDSLPPSNYMCHRCRVKGHWIQNCPTNNDPNFDNNSKNFKNRFKINNYNRKRMNEINNERLSKEENEFNKLAPNNINNKNTLFENQNENENNFYKVLQENISNQSEKQQKIPKPKKNKSSKEFFFLNCPLCEKNYEAATYVSCCHFTFCYSCIEKNITKEKKCPVCKTNIKFIKLKSNLVLRDYLNEIKSKNVKIERSEFFKPSQRILQDSEFMATFKETPAEMKPFVNPRVFLDLQDRFTSMNGYFNKKESKDFEGNKKFRGYR